MFGETTQPTKMDLAELESLTASYLGNYFFATVNSKLIRLDEMDTKVVSHTNANSDDMVTTLRIAFHSTTHISYNSPIMPTAWLDTVMMEALRGESLNGYLGMIQALPVQNFFAATTEIFFVGQTPGKDQESGSASMAFSLRSNTTATISIVTVSLAACIGAMIYFCSWRKNELITMEQSTTTIQKEEDEASLSQTPSDFEKDESIVSESIFTFTSSEYSEERDLMQRFERKRKENMDS